MGLSLDSILGSLFFYLTALHLFHLYAALIFLFTFIGVSYSSIYVVSLRFISSSINPLGCFFSTDIYLISTVLAEVVKLETKLIILFQMVMSVKLLLFLCLLKVIIPPRWIRLATGNFYFWFTYSSKSYFFMEISDCIGFSVILYLHFVFIIWMVIDFSLGL